MLNIRFIQFECRNCRCDDPGKRCKNARKSHHKSCLWVRQFNWHRVAAEKAHCGRDGAYDQRRHSVSDYWLLTCIQSYHIHYAFVLFGARAGWAGRSRKFFVHEKRTKGRMRNKNVVGNSTVQKREEGDGDDEYFLFVTVAVIFLFSIRFWIFCSTCECDCVCTSTVCAREHDWNGEWQSRAKKDALGCGYLCTERY